MFSIGVFLARENVFFPEREMEDLSELGKNFIKKDLMTTIMDKNIETELI